MESTEICSVLAQLCAYLFSFIAHMDTYHAVLCYFKRFIARHVCTYGSSISNIEQIGQMIKVDICAFETDDVPKMLHTCGSATLLEAENTLNTSEGSHDQTHAPKLP